MDKILRPEGMSPECKSKAKKGRFLNILIGFIVVCLYFPTICEILKYNENVVYIKIFQDIFNPKFGSRTLFFLRSSEAELWGWAVPSSVQPVAS